MTRCALLSILFGFAAPFAVATTGVDGRSGPPSEPAGIAQRSQDPSRPNTVTTSGTVVLGAWKHYGPYDLLAGQSLTASLSGTGDADLYVRKGTPPTNTTFDCRPHMPTSNETCTVWGPGKVYVSVQGYGAVSTFSLAISFVSRSQS